MPLSALLEKYGEGGSSNPFVQLLEARKKWDNIIYDASGDSKATWVARGHLGRARTSRWDRVGWDGLLPAVSHPAEIAASPGHTTRQAGWGCISHTAAGPLKYIGQLWSCEIFISS